MLEQLDRDIQELEALAEKNNRDYEQHPQFLGYRNEFYNCKEYALKCERLAGYLKQLRQFLSEENDGISI